MIIWYNYITPGDTTAESSCSWSDVGIGLEVVRQFWYNHFTTFPLTSIKTMPLWHGGHVAYEDRGILKS